MDLSFTETVNQSGDQPDSFDIQIELGTLKQSETISPGARDSKKRNTKISKYLYTAHQPTEYFYVVLSGNVQVRVGTEKFKVDNGPFSFIGIGTLQDPDRKYFPDFDATVVGLSKVLRIS